MLMLEHDAKVILSRYGIPVPAGILIRNVPSDGAPFPGPWVVKAQVPTGGRGKASGIELIDEAGELASTVARMIGSRLKGHPVRECRIEQAVTAKQEAYASFSLEPRTARIRVLLSSVGGIDVEEVGAGHMMSGTAFPTTADLTREVERLAEQLPEDLRRTMQEAGTRLAALFARLDLILLEINPIFILDDGSWLAGDAKVIADDNALVRQDGLSMLLRDRSEAYPDVAFKFAHGFDFVVLDPEGEIGLVTTGAGLSMKLIDELLDQGARPFNFCDIRTGQMRGDPARLIHVLERIAEGPNIRAVLVNIFAGITDLAEFSRLLIQALKAVPQLDVPVVVRLVGNSEDEAAALLESSGLPLVLESELDRAVARAVRRPAGEDFRDA